MATATLNLDVKAAGAIKSIKNVENALGSVDRAGDKTKARLGKGGIFSGIGGAAKRAGSFLAGPGGLIMGLTSLVGVGAGLSGLKNKLDVADALAKSARQANLTVESLSAMQYAANQMGVANDAFTETVAKANRRLGDFANRGSGAAKNALEQLGITQDDLNTKLITGEDRFNAVLQALVGVEDPAMRAKAAFDIGGKSLEAMVMQMGNSTAGFEKLKTEAAEVGAVIGTDFAESSERINDKMDKLSKTFGAIGISIAEKLLPRLEPLLDKVLANAPAIVDKIMVGFSGLMAVFDAISPIISSLWPLFELLFKTIEIGWAIAKPIIQAMADIIGGMANAVTIGLEKVIETFDNMKNAIMDKVKAMLDWMPNWVKKKLGLTEDAFQNTSDKVVGNSIIPNMVTGIKDEMGKLDGIMGGSLDATVNGLAAPAIANGGGGGSPVFSFNIGTVNAGEGGPVSQEDLNLLAAGILREANTAILRQQRVGGTLNA
jgi:phage-related protein